MLRLPKIFADTSNIEEIEKLVSLDIISGITTNPLIVAKEAKDEKPDTYYLRLVKRFPNLPISIQLLDKSFDELLSDARKFAKISSNIIIKIPMFSDGRGLKLISKLSQEGISTNVTALMTAEQAALALIAGKGKGPQYISLFFNRIKDGGGDPEKEIKKTRKMLEEFSSQSEIIAGSIRSGEDVYNCALYGAHIITVAPKVILSMIDHPKSSEFINQAQKSWDEFLSNGEKKQIEPKRKITLPKSPKFAAA